ncbi:MAG: hypothetical protein FWD81_05095 [Methanomassiliicoccaceae archaeon]|nr:hypothetical protein [Methanomassiliicoccaceae archaeon]
MAEMVIKGETITVGDGMTIEDVMLSLGKHPDAFLYLLDGRPIPMTTHLTENMKVDALRVASGG